MNDKLVVISPDVNYADVRFGFRILSFPKETDTEHTKRRRAVLDRTFNVLRDFPNYPATDLSRFIKSFKVHRDYMVDNYSNRPTHKNLVEQACREYKELEEFYHYVLLMCKLDISKIDH